jgi:hypothetical protein
LAHHQTGKSNYSQPDYDFFLIHNVTPVTN